jgi:dTDP-D-glucose 4,6-dehydratase
MFLLRNLTVEGGTSIILKFLKWKNEVRKILHIRNYSLNRYYGFYIDELKLITNLSSYVTPEIKSGYTLKNNIFGTKNLLELAVIKKVESFLFFSSSEVYGEVSEERMPIKEDNLWVFRSS